jgi:integrase
MASIRARGTGGALLFDFRIHGERIREQTRLPDTRANRQRLRRLLRNIERDIAIGDFRYANYFPGGPNAERVANAQTIAGKCEGGLPTFAEFALLWIQENTPTWKRSHRITVEGAVSRWLAPAFAEKSVNRIDKADLLAFRADMSSRRPALSSSRINKVVGIACAILKEAAERYDFPAPGIGVRALRLPRVDIDPFSLSEVLLVIEHAPKVFQNYYTVRFFTGMRTAEVDGLCWEYVDFGRGLILVRKTIVDGKTETPKTRESARDIEMTPIVRHALELQHKLTNANGKYVFPTEAGTPLDHRNVRDRVWYPLLDRLGLKRRRPYTTRHTAATLMLAAGENPEWIQKQMGHATTEMLFRVCSRYVPNLTRQDGSAFARLISLHETKKITSETE